MIGGAGVMDAQMLRMSLAMGAPSSRNRELSPRDTALCKALNTLKINVGLTSLQATEGEPEASLSNSNFLCECDVSDLTNVDAFLRLQCEDPLMIGRVSIHRPSERSVPMSSCVYAAALGALRVAADFLRKHAVPDSMEASQNTPSINPFLLLAAMISSERKRQSTSAGSQLRFPLQLLEQMLWCTQTRFSPSPETVPSRGVLQWFDAEIQDVLSAFLSIRERVEYAPDVPKDQGDEESDEDYLDRIRPKSYLDFVAPSLPRRRPASAQQ
mmetsp:Transcript_62851/g.73135  ORF Transcript_62851/g.73135 Transcript_62851/m.73135 type:complete len:270 (+) Transcript_62851:3-812(+)